MMMGSVPAASTPPAIMEPAASSSEEGDSDDAFSVRVGAGRTGTHTFPRHLRAARVTVTSTQARVLGMGMYGVVLEARSDDTGARLAVKLQALCALSYQMGAEEVDQDVVYEGAVLAAATRRLDPDCGLPALHSAAVVYCECCEPARAFAVFAMARAPGLPLLHESERSRCTRTFAMGGEPLRRAALALTRPLVALHSLGLYHGDLKPQHLLLDTASGTARASLVDLGFASTQGRLRRAPLYTSWWRPLEAWDSALADSVGQASDVFALALCVLELTAVPVPYRPRTLGEAREAGGALREALREALRDIDAPLCDALLPCLAPEAAARPSAAALARSLAALAGVADALPAEPRAARRIGTLAGADVQALESELRVFTSRALAKDVAAAVGAARLGTEVEAVRRTAWMLRARLAECEPFDNSEHAALVLALRLHWPLATRGFAFDDPSIAACSDDVFCTLPPWRSVGAVNRALTLLGWDLLP